MSRASMGQQWTAFEFRIALRVELIGVGQLVQYTIEDCVGSKDGETVGLREGAVPVHVVL